MFEKSKRKIEAGCEDGQMVNNERSQSDAESSQASKRSVFGAFPFRGTWERQKTWKDP